MERRLKERLVGAAILVVLIVLVVPELLSGPRSNGAKESAVSLSPSAESRGEPTRTVTVDLDTKREMALETPAEGAAALGAAAPGAPPLSEPATAVPPTTGAPPQVPRAAPVQSSPPPPPAVPPSTIDNQAAAAKSWTLQLGSFSSLENADHLVRLVKAQNSPAYLSKSGTGKSVRYRVRVGPLADRAAADRMLAKMKSEGHAASIVAR